MSNRILQRFVIGVFFAAALAVPSFARDVLVPVVTGTAGNRTFRTTIVVTNRTNAAAECVFTYRSPGRANHPLISRETIAAGQVRVYEDFLVEVSAAGTIRADCTAGVELVTRLQDSSDGGKTFRAGRLFRPFPIDHFIKEGTPGMTRAASDVAIAEVAGKAVHVEVSAANFGGVEYAHAAYDVPPYALRIVSLADVLQKLPATDVTVTVSGKGAIVVGRETREPALANVAVHRIERQKAPQVVASSAPPSSVIGMLGISSFKAAPFVEPMTGDVYMRDRWYNPGTGTFLTPDREGYAGGANLYSYCGGDPVNCSDPTGLRAMTAEDKRHLAALRARGKKLHTDFMSAGRAEFNQYLLVPVGHSWSDTNGPIGGDYAQQLVPSMVTTQSAYEASRRSMVSDVLTFEAAVARADENGQIYYNAGIGFTTITAADRKSADRATMVAAGVFFATDEVPMMLSPYSMRGQVFEPARAPLEIGKALPGTTALVFGANDLVYGTSSGGRLRSLQREAGGVLLSDMYRHKPAGMTWTEFSYRTMDQAAATGRPIRFDLTNVGDIENVLNNRGPYANAVTAHELRYLRQNWSRFERNVFFYRNGVEVGMPWE